MKTQTTTLEMTQMSESDIAAYESGERELKELLGIDAEYLAELKGRAQLFLDGGHEERALIMLEMLEALDRTDAAPSLAAAELLLARGCSDAAQAKIAAVLARDPSCADAQVALAEVQIAAGELVPAAAALGRVIARDPQGRTAAGQRARAVAAAAHARCLSA